MNLFKKKEVWNWIKPELNKDKDEWKNTTLCLFVSTAFLLLMYLILTPHVFMGKTVTLIMLAVFITNIILICFKSFKQMKLHQIAFWVIIILGVLSLLIQPIGNIPDEFVHIARSEATSRLQLFFHNKMDGDFTSIYSVEVILKNGNKTYQDLQNIMSQPVDTTVVKFGSMARTNVFFVYLPQAVGMLLAKLFHTSIITFLWMGRFFNLLAYAFVVRLTLRIMPKFKMPMFFIAALPMSIQQAASCSPDALINALSFLTIGYFVYLLCDERKLIGKREILIYILLASLTGVAKLNNIVFAALILTIPKIRFKSQKKILLVKIFIVLAPVVIGAAYYGYTLTFPEGPISPNSYYAINNVYPSQQYDYILHNFFPWLRDFIGAMINNFTGHMMQLNTFGWLDQPNSLMTIIMIFIFGYLFLKEERTPLSIWSKLFILLIVFGNYTLINFAMYTGWTSVGSTNIEGVQGRYLIPLIALLPVVFSRKQLPEEVIEEQTSQGKLCDSIQLTRLVTAISSLCGVMYIMLATKYY